MSCISTTSSSEGPQDSVEWHCFDYDVTFEDYSLMSEFEPGHCVVSEKFAAGKYNWELQYYPNGVDEDSKGFASVFIKRSLQWYNDSIAIKARFHIIMHDHESYGYGMDNNFLSPLDPSVHIFSPQNPVWGFNRFKSKSAVEQRCWDKKHNCIRLRCYIWVTTDCSYGVTRRVRKREEPEESED